MRTVGDRGVHDYALIYRNKAASLSIWRMHLPASGNRPEMTLTTIDGRDPATPGAHKRNVTITLAVGPRNKPYWEGVIAYGSHTRH